MKFISKGYKYLPIGNLLSFFCEKVNESKEDPFETTDSPSLEVKSYVIDIIFTFITKSEEALIEFYAKTPVNLIFFVMFYY